MHCFHCSCLQERGKHVLNFIVNGVVKATHCCVSVFGIPPIDDDIASLQKRNLWGGNAKVIEGPKQTFGSKVLILPATPLTSLSMKSSTAWPALTRRIMRRGVFSFDTMSSRDSAPITLVPLASFCKKSCTLDTVLLKAQTWTRTKISYDAMQWMTSCDMTRDTCCKLTTKPWSFIFRIRFWPITARPIKAISALWRQHHSLVHSTTHCEKDCNVNQQLM